MKYLLIFFVFLSFKSNAQTINKKDSFYMYRAKANLYQDSIEKCPKLDTATLKKLWAKRHYFYAKQKYWEEKFYSF